MSKRNYYKKENMKRNDHIGGTLQKQPSFNSHQKLFFHTKQPYYTLQDKANPNAPPTYQIYHGPSQPMDTITPPLTLTNNINLSSIHSTTNADTNTETTTNTTTSTLSSPPLQTHRPKNILSELVVSSGDELVFQTKKSEIENSLKLIKSIEDRYTEDHLQQDKIFLSRINSYTNGYIPLLHLTAYSDISKYSQNNLEYMANAIETYSRQLELNPERTHVKRKGQGTALPLEELIANLVPTAKRTLVALNIDSTQKQKQQEILDQCRHYLKELDEEEEKKRKELQNKKINEIPYNNENIHYNFNHINSNQKDTSSIPSLFIQRSVRIVYVEDPRDYRNMFYKPEDLCKDIFEPMDAIPYALLEFDSERTANYIYNCFENDRKKNNSNFVVKKRFRNFRKFNNNNNNNNANGVDNKNKNNKSFSKNYQNNNKKDKNNNKYNKKSNNYYYNNHNSYNNNNNNGNNNGNNNINDNNHKNFRNRNSNSHIDNNNKNNHRKSYTKMIATPPESSEILNNGSSTMIPSPSSSMKSNENHNHNSLTNNVNGFINTNDEIYISNTLISSAATPSTLSSPTNSPMSINLNNNHRTSLDMSNPNVPINHISSFMNPLNTFNNNVNVNVFNSTPNSQPQTQPQNHPTIQTSNQFTSDLTSTLTIKRNSPGDIVITSPANNIIDTSPTTLHSGNSANSGIKPSLFNSSPTFAKEYQKQQVFFQNNVQYNGKICQLDPMKSSGYIQLSDEVISVLLNDTRNEGKSFELIKSYLVYFSYSDVEASHLENMKVGDNVSFKVKMTFIAPNSTSSPVSMNSSNLSPLDMEDNSITQAFDIFIKNKNNIPPDVLEMMKMMENIF